MSEAVREMTFDEEYEILQAEKNELFAEEDERAEPPFANCVVRRALRCIRKLKEEREQYRAIGTVEELRELKERATAKKPIETEEFTEGGWIGKCPSCGLDCNDAMNYCDQCGQKLLWD